MHLSPSRSQSRGCMGLSPDRFIHWDRRSNDLSLNNNVDFMKWSVYGNNVYIKKGTCGLRLRPLGFAGGTSEWGVR